MGIIDAINPLWTASDLRLDTSATPATTLGSERGAMTLTQARARATPSGLLVNFHCRIDPATSVNEAHAEVDALERAVRDEIPDILRVIGHVEPARR